MFGLRKITFVAEGGSSEALLWSPGLSEIIFRGDRPLHYSVDVYLIREKKFFLATLMERKFKFLLDDICHL